MNKKLNTALFFLGATAVNILLVFVMALAVFVPYAIFLAPRMAGAVNLGVLVAVILGSMAGSFPVYRWLVEQFQKKVDMEKYFDPIVRQSSKGRRR